ncbi:MAG: flagellar export chaperone FliS [Candidatus Latescibacteria bacterium]|nr:flagellar export chaperone FliS [bacterium]MBD3425249.1 flagellar export chaperone FliS [Candidatus Latescibacterota bacterium]
MQVNDRSADDAMKQYNKVKVETSDQLTLINLLYDGLYSRLNGAVEKMKRGEQAHADCVRARDITQNLLDTIRDDGGELANNLKSLYLFIYRQVVLGDMERSVTRIEGILPVVKELRAGWRELKVREESGERDA